MLRTALLAALISCSVDAGTASYAPPTAAPSGVADTLEFDHTYADWSALLAAHVRGDALDYAGLVEQSAELDKVLRGLTGVTPTQLRSWTKDERYAFWINVYNAHCVKLVVDGYPLESIRDLGGSLIGRVWDKEFIQLSDHHPDGDEDPLSLNDVEHEILRPRFRDARVHAAINCASTSCPPLRDEAFVATKLEAQLDEQMRSFIADTRRNRLNEAAGELELSSIFDWFEEDFERDAGSVRQYVARYAQGDTAWILSADVEYLDYDWSLNDAPR